MKISKVFLKKQSIVDGEKGFIFAGEAQGTLK